MNATRTKIADVTAFESLFKTHYKKLCFYAYTILGDMAIAEELVSDVFAEIWEKRNEIIFRSSVNAYLYRAVYHRCLNYIRHKQVRNAFEEYLIRREADNVFTTVPTYALEEKELDSILREAIAKLPGKCREIFELSRDHNLRYKEIAEVLKISTKTVENQMTIALRKLKMLLRHTFFL